MKLDLVKENEKCFTVYTPQGNLCGELVKHNDDNWYFEYDNEDGHQEINYYDGIVSVVSDLNSEYEAFLDDSSLIAFGSYIRCQEGLK